MEMSEFRKKTYIPKEQRKNLLLLSDDLRMTSGIATMSREIVFGTCQHYNWFQVGAAIQHPEEGKLVDMSAEVAKETGVSDACVKVLPSSGYGNETLIRQIMDAERVDGIFFYTDPRFWIWLFSMEHELRQKVPYLYYNVWDNLPYPEYNSDFYKSCDGLFSISKQTLNINKVVLGDYNYEEI